MNPIWKRARRNRVNIVVHCVWTTAQRRPLLLPEYEPLAFDAVRQEAAGLGCDVITLGGMPDHVHLLVNMPTTVSVAQLLQRVKGVSSARVRDHIREADPSPDRPFFAWSDGYGVFSIGPEEIDVERVRRYIENQKAHHGNGLELPDGARWLMSQ